MQCCCASNKFFMRRIFCKKYCFQFLLQQRSVVGVACMHIACLHLLASRRHHYGPNIPCLLCFVRYQMPPSIDDYEGAVICFLTAKGVKPVDIY